ncbi:hypothetical protein BJX61DRAFT_33402 [Aspergillus egyptiacus]|nr:hypothetical protein BJX61DRAFT_33402 [Aspergillus egyptiacus]
MGVVFFRRPTIDSGMFFVFAVLVPSLSLFFSNAVQRILLPGRLLSTLTDSDSRVSPPTLDSRKPEAHATIECISGLYAYVTAVSARLSFFPAKMMYLRSGLYVLADIDVLRTLRGALAHLLQCSTVFPILLLHARCLCTFYHRGLLSICIPRRIIRLPQVRVDAPCELQTLYVDCVITTCMLHSVLVSLPWSCWFYL